MQHTKRINFRLTENEYKLLQAKSNARVLTKYCRSAALHPAVRPDPPLAGVVEKLERVVSILKAREGAVRGIEHGKD